MPESTSRAAGLTRRMFLKRSARATAAAALGATVTPVGSSLVGSAPAGEVIDLASRRELFVDGALIARLGGRAHHRLHEPVPREIAIRHDASWEGTACAYHSVFRDADVYRLYYRGWHLEVTEGRLNARRHPPFLCYAESDDGVHWRKPHVGLHEFQGSRQNNIVLVSGPRGPLQVDAGHPAVFLDENPDASEGARFKAILRSREPNGLLPFRSPDGLRWTPMTDAPVLHDRGAFDSQNLAFWDPNIGKYRAYWRVFTAGVTNDDAWKPAGIRAIRTATSDDLIHWGPHTDLTYEDSPPEQLYTNQIKPYHRAPHLLIGFPTRYVERGWSESMRQLPARRLREMRASVAERYGTALTDTLFMVSRDGTRFTRWNEAFLRPGIERPEAWQYGQGFIAWHVVETKSTLPGAPNELSLYSSEAYWHGRGSALRRYTLRLDGFASVRAPGAGGELITRPLRFEGSRLTLNVSTSAAGSVRVEIQNAAGEPIPGHTLAECPPTFGDSLERTVTWKSGAGVGALAGKPVRLRFVLSDADLYGFRFL